MIWPLTIIVFVVLGALAFRPTRWAYFTFVALGLLFFPARIGFHFHPQPCECALNVPLTLFSLTNYKHIALFAIFFSMTIAQCAARALALNCWLRQAQCWQWEPMLSWHRGSPARAIAASVTSYQIWPARSWVQACSSCCGNFVQNNGEGGRSRRRRR